MLWISDKTTGVAKATFEIKPDGHAYIGSHQIATVDEISSVGGLAQLCPHEKVGYVVPVEHKAIADAILRFYDSSNQEELINNVIEEKKKYSWNILVENILDTFNKIKE